MTGVACASYFPSSKLKEPWPKRHHYKFKLGATNAAPLKLGIKMKKMLEFIGADASRVSGQAEKFWEIT
jgi:hypothetical protein